MSTFQNRHEKLKFGFTCLGVLVALSGCENLGVTTQWSVIAPEASPLPLSQLPSAGGTRSSAASWFSPSIFFNQSIRNAPVDSQSSVLISNLVARGGWGYSRFQIDFSIDVYYADSSSSRIAFNPGAGAIVDGDFPATVAVPPGFSTEGFESPTGRTCDGGDCHYSVVDTERKELVEAYQANVVGSVFSSNGGVTIWPFQKNYPVNLRGDVCTSADAGGFPIAPMLFTAEEVAAGEIKHAIRFIIPNNRIQCRTYVRPATHGTGPSNCLGWATTNGIPYGARLRLRPDYPLTGLSAGAQVVVKALQEYGMILADGGNIALTAKSDAHSTQKWAGLLGSRDLQAISPNDFVMIEAGPRIAFTSYDCVRNP